MAEAKLEKEKLLN